MITHSLLKQRLQYDPIKGQFTWNAIPNAVHHQKIWNARFAGTIAGSIDKAGYTRIKIGGSSEAAHRLAWLWMTGKEPSDEIDHKDGDRSNNRFDNLREATRAQNCHNKKAKAGSSEFKGVYFNKQSKKWIANITINRVRHYLKSWKTEEAAHAAYREAAERLHGDFARAA